MPEQLSTGATARRERARSNDGRFGEQQRPDLPTVASSDGKAAGGPPGDLLERLERDVGARGARLDVHNLDSGAAQLRIWDTDGPDGDELLYESTVHGSLAEALAQLPEDLRVLDGVAGYWPAARGQGSTDDSDAPSESAAGDSSQEVKMADTTVAPVRIDGDPAEAAAEMDHDQLVDTFLMYWDAASQRAVNDGAEAVSEWAACAEACLTEIRERAQKDSDYVRAATDLPDLWEAWLKLKRALDAAAEPIWHYDGD